MPVRASPERLWAALREAFARQAERWPLWAPIASGCGAAGYFSLKLEPPLAPAVISAALAVAAALLARAWGRSQGLAVALTLVAFGLSGFAAGAIRTASVASPVAPAGRGPAMVEGYVVEVVSADASRPRLLIAPTRIEGLEPKDTPRRVRIRVRDGEAVGPGVAVRLRAVLNPPPPPASPGSYDFARDAYFEGIGGSGFSLSPPQIIELGPPPPAMRPLLALNAFRWSLARRIVDKMGTARGGPAVAMITGHQAWLDADDVEAMRDSGLAHILSISGVHMAIVGGFVFALVRLLVAAWPWLALRVPGKKVAASAGLIAVIAYLAISGAPPPAERAAITAGVAFLAILCNRKALSLHSLAVAALAVLALGPEAVMQPGFQMSFAATAALLALAEAWPRPTRELNTPWPIRLVQRLRVWLVAGFMVSLIAGTATGPFAIQHFNRVTLWGLPANLATEALSTFVIMPALAVGAALELMGLGGPALAAAGWGLERMVEIARAFAGWPHAVAVVASAPDWTLAASFLGLLFVCLWRGRLRWLGLIAFAAVVVCPRPPTPALWVAAGGANVGVAEASRATILRPTVQTFGSELWSRRRGLALPEEDKAEAELARAYDCDRDDCLPLASAPVKVAAWWRLRPPSAAELEVLCESAEVVIVRTGAAQCPGRLVLDAPAMARGGAAEIYREPSGWRVVWAQDQRGRRPWSASQGDEAASDSGG